MKKIILASSSPRRKELMEKLQIPFEIRESNVNEEQIEVDNSPYERVKALSSAKANAVAKTVEGPAIIIGADTVVSCLGRILNKPQNTNDAVQMLKTLQGRKHSVYSGLTLILKNADGSQKETNYVDATDVSMHELSQDEIKAYVDTNECMDKAGAYAIQGKGAIFIESISGDYYTVMGLPLAVLYRALRENGVNIMDFWK